MLWGVFLANFGKYFSLVMYIFSLVTFLVVKLLVTNLFTWPPKRSVEFKIYINRARKHNKTSNEIYKQKYDFMAMKKLLPWLVVLLKLLIYLAVINSLVCVMGGGVGVIWYLLSPILIPSVHSRGKGYPVPVSFVTTSQGGNSKVPDTPVAWGVNLMKDYDLL